MHILYALYDLHNLKYHRSTAVTDDDFFKNVMHSIPSVTQTGNTSMLIFAQE